MQLSSEHLSELKIDVGNKGSKHRLRRATPCFETPEKAIMFCHA